MKNIKKYSEYIKESNDAELLKPIKIKVDMSKVIDKVEKNKNYKIEL
jgi:hypothetical protein